MFCDARLAATSIPVRVSSAQTVITRCSSYTLSARVVGSSRGP